VARGAPAALGLRAGPADGRRALACPSPTHRAPAMHTRPARLALAAALALLAAPAAARAQFATIEARAGAAPVVGGYRDALGTGQLIGVGASVRVTPTLSVRADADAVPGWTGAAHAGPLQLPARASRRSSPPGARAPAARPCSSPRRSTAASRSSASAAPRRDARNEFRPPVSAGLGSSPSSPARSASSPAPSAGATLLSDDAAAGRCRARRRRTLVVVPVVAGVRIQVLGSPGRGTGEEGARRMPSRSACPPLCELRGED
jgi:hypothetical protein